MDKFKDIFTELNSKEDNRYNFLNFLDYFYSVDNKGKLLSIADEPNIEHISSSDKGLIVTMVAGIHFLCTYFEIDIPSWIFKQDYILTDWYYATGGIEELNSYAKLLSPNEFLYHKVYGDPAGLLMRL